MTNKIRYASAKAPLLGVAAVVGVMVLTFQNCSKVNFAANQVSNAEFESTSQMTINKGAKYTNTIGVKVQFTVPTAVDVYLTNDSTCTTGGTYQQMVPELPWNLGETNSTATVYAKFKANGGTELPCISASIIHDDQPPVVTFTKYPTGFSKNLVEVLGVDGQDAVSGVDHFECRAPGATTFSVCSSSPQASGAVDGAYSFQVRAVDKAGNTSSPVEKDWIFDHTPPSISIVSGPSNPSVSPIAQFVLSATDATSGVDHLVCSLDGGAPGTCATTVTFSNPLLMNGNHTFAAYAVDKAGNQSQPATYAWTVNVPVGGFQVIGVAGPAGSSDQTPDQYLTGSLMPTVSWSASSNADHYSLSIYPTGSSTALCTQNNIPATANPMYSFGAGCVLMDGSKYDIGMMAVTANNATYSPTKFTFLVDISGPVVTFGTPVISADQKTVTLPYTVADSGSGVRSATCSTYNMKDQSTIASGDCTTSTSITLTNLIDGQHTFTVVASDKAGNSTTANENFTSLLIVCDPLIGVNANCKQGLQSYLWYMTDAQRAANPFDHVDDYYNYGTKAATLIYMSSVFVPTRSFETGFNGADGSYVTDNTGAKLTEWFALDLQGYYKLGNDSKGVAETDGYYQFAVISDDGGVLQTKDSSGNWIDYLNNDGYSSSRLGCDTKGIKLTAGQAWPIRIKYFQGPRTQIALTLMIRKLPSAPTAANLAETECGNSGNDYFFGPNYDDFSATHHYGQMLTRGWYVPDSSHFELAIPK